MPPKTSTDDMPDKDAAKAGPQSAPAEPLETGEVGGPDGPEPTRYGDWEKKGRCIDF